MLEQSCLCLLLFHQRSKCRRANGLTYSTVQNTNTVHFQRAVNGWESCPSALQAEPRPRLWSSLINEWRTAAAPAPAPSSTQAKASPAHAPNDPSSFALSSPGAAFYYEAYFAACLFVCQKQGLLYGTVQYVVFSQNGEVNLGELLGELASRHHHDVALRGRELA